MRAMSSAQIPAGSDAVRRAGVDERVPDGDGALGVHPDLVAEVARVAGARDRDRHVAQPGVDEPEVLERADVGGRQLLEDGARQRSLERERADLCRHVLDDHVHALRVHPQPARVRLGARQAVRPVVEAADRAVVDDLAVGVAPRRVQHLPDGALGDVARDHAVEQPRRVAARDQVLVERRHVEKRRRIADRRVLAIGVGVVRGRDLMAGPAAPGLRPYQRGGSRVKGGL